MVRLLRRRITSSALPLLVVILGVFFLARLTGDPANLYLPLSATEEMHRLGVRTIGVENSDGLFEHEDPLPQREHVVNIRARELCETGAAPADPAHIPAAASLKASPPRRSWSHSNSSSRTKSCRR